MEDIPPNFFPSFALLISFILLSVQLFSTVGTISQPLGTVKEIFSADDPTIPNYDSDGDGVFDANDSHPTNAAISQQIFGGAAISEWPTTASIIIDVGYPTTNPNEMPESMEWGDIDNDGDIDLFLSRRNGPNQVWSNDGSGSLNLVNWNHNRIDDTRNSVLVDLNSDGWLDVISANTLSTNNMYFNNNGSFNQTVDWQSALGGDSTSVSVGDIDGDNDLDIHFSSKYDYFLENINGVISNNTLWTEPAITIPHGEGEFGQNQGFSQTYASVLGDLDRDGDIDLIQENYIVGNIDSEIYPHNIIWLNNGNNTFGQQNPSGQEEPDWISWHAHYGEDIELADLDGDGLLEIITASSFEPPTAAIVLVGDSIYQNNNGTFNRNSSWTSSTARYSTGVAAGDLDFDGDLDLVFSNGGFSTRNNSNNVFINQNGSFATSPSWISDNKSTMDVQLLDFDGDKDLDIAYLRRNSSNGPFYVEIFVNPWSNLDKDMWGDDDDDCPLVAGNSTEDRLGCPDSDGDGWSDTDSTWTWGMGADRFENNSDQHTDTDGDGWGDNSNGTDGDGCPEIWGNSTQGGVLGCIDSDGDDWADTIDWNVSDSTQWADDDSDSYGDNPDGTNGDDCPGEWGNSTEGGILGCLDSDGDGWGDVADWASGDASQWADSDSDGYGDESTGTQGDDCNSTWGNSTENGTLGCIDTDGDGWAESDDWLPTDKSQWIDDDDDDRGDNPNGTNGDACPGVWGNSTEGGILGCVDSDGDGWADIVDVFINESSQWADWDGDGYGDNQNGSNADDCPEQFGVSYRDVLGCADWDADGVSNTNDPAPLDASLAIDDDGDNIDNSIDNCPSTSNVNQEDYDLDQIGDVCDDDDDNDTILDLADSCSLGEKGWISESVVDVDGDGCRDLTEDLDDDGDGISDGEDLCTSSAMTYTGWVSTNGTENASNITDWDGDGCEDATTEDLDDDNDGIVDVKDHCRYSVSNWRSTETTDEDSDGCEDISQDSDGDGTIDKFDQCPNTGENITVDDRGCSMTQIQDNVQQFNTNEHDNMSFGEKLATGDLDAIGLLLAIFIPIIGVGLTIIFQQRKRANINRLRKLILSAKTKVQLHEAKALLRKSVAEEKLTQAQYNLLLEEIDSHMEEMARDSTINTENIGEDTSAKSKGEWHKAVAAELKDASYRVDDEGVEWWEDEKKIWWYRKLGDDQWSKWDE
jgi:hypothetical protein